MHLFIIIQHHLDWQAEVRSLRQQLSDAEGRAAGSQAQAELERQRAREIEALVGQARLHEQRTAAAAQQV